MIGTGGRSAFDDGDVGDLCLRPNVSPGKGRSLVCSKTSDELGVTSVLSLIRGVEDPEGGWLV